MKLKIKTLIVDDSRIFRSAMEEALTGLEYIQVVGSVRNGIKAMEFIRKTPVDMVTLDVNMPEMDGLETLRAIQDFNASHADSPDIGVIMVSSLTHRGADITIQALELGAFDFITKTEGKNADESIAALREQLSTRIWSLSSKHNRAIEKKPASPDAVPSLSRTLTKTENSGEIKAVLIGVSTGGPKALISMLPELSEKVDLPILIVQHMPPAFTQSLAESLNKKCAHTVKEGKHNEIITKKNIYIAPGGQHMLLRRSDANGECLIVINEQPPVAGCRPSVDVLFRSAAAAFGGNVIVIILTGMGSDGTKGIAPLKQAGAYAIAQDKKTSIVWGMPGSAVKAGMINEILPLDKIPDAVDALLRGKKRNNSATKALRHK